jgi:hypothetical protein
VAVAFCRVSYRDVEGIQHSVDVTAESLYEAVAIAIARFRRDDGFPMFPPGPACEFRVQMLADSPVTHSMALNKVESFAVHGTVSGPKDIMPKERIRLLLGLEGFRWGSRHCTRSWFDPHILIRVTLAVVLPFLAECVRQPGESTDAHAKAKVAALHD